MTPTEKNFEIGTFILTVLTGLMMATYLSTAGHMKTSSLAPIGFLLILWSVAAAFRLLFLSTQSQDAEGNTLSLPQRILTAMNKKRQLKAEEEKKALLSIVFERSFINWAGLAFALALWTTYCTFSPALPLTIKGLDTRTAAFLMDSGLSPLSTSVIALFPLLRDIALILCLLGMGLLFRSYAFLEGPVRSALIILCSYLTAGFILLAGLNGLVPPDIAPTTASLSGSGAGTSSWLTSLIPTFPAHNMTGFHKILMESGLIGLIFTVLLFAVPFTVFLKRWPDPVQRFYSVCGLLALILLAAFAFIRMSGDEIGFNVLGWMAVFLAWGAGSARDAKLVSRS